MDPRRFIHRQLAELEKLKGQTKSNCYILNFHKQKIGHIWGEPQQIVQYIHYIQSQIYLNSSINSYKLSSTITTSYNLDRWRVPLSNTLYRCILDCENYTN